MTGTDNRKLRLRFHGRIIDHLGIQMYQSPIAAIAEMVANAWDADSENVWITLPNQLDDNAEIVLRDDGSGMTFEQCQDCYLNVGWCRRGINPDEKSPEKERSILGRKGIGKFAGFGIAKVITVQTISRETGEKTVFQLDIGNLRSSDYVRTDGGEIPVVEYLPSDEIRREEHGTIITLQQLTLRRRFSPESFSRSMARRFLLHQQVADFKVIINDSALPEAEQAQEIEFVFPRDYKSEEKPDDLSVENDWGIETLSNNRRIKWRIQFYKSTIDEEELRGVAIFSRGKLAQNPFFFNLSGGLGGQHGQEYVSGHVQADYIDLLDEDIIAPERQRINWEHEEAIPLEQWGQDRVKQLLRLWRERRGEKRRKQIEEKVAEFSRRLEKLPSRERNTVKKALYKLGSIATLSDPQFQELGEGVLLAWEQGRLHDLIDEISSADTLSEKELLEILLEAHVLTALNTAEAVKTKLLTVGGLKLRIQNRDLETAVRDYIAKHPWLISAEWETFRKERSVRKLTEDAAGEAGLTGDAWEGRIDLALASGEHLLILEFMRPGLNLDWEHLDRFERYIRVIRTRVEANTAGPFRRVTGYIVADGLSRDSAMLGKINDMRRHGMFALDWSSLFGSAVASWQEFLETLVSRAPDDERLRALLETGEA